MAGETPHRPTGQWPRTPDGGLAMHTRKLDLDDLLREVPLTVEAPAPRQSAPGTVAGTHCV